MSRKFPASILILYLIVICGSVVILFFRTELQSILATQLQTPDSWCIDQPCIHIGNLVLSQPSSTILVYILAAVTIWTGFRFIRMDRDQMSRLWWGTSLLLTGIGAALAGTSYQAFGYELKCRGYDYCLWTSWWEIAYMICTMAGAGAAFIAVAYASLSTRSQRFWTAYALISTGFYVFIVIIGLFRSNRILLSFELMIAFTGCGGFAIFSQSLIQYVKSREVLIKKIIGVYCGLVITIIFYFLALLSGIGPRLWANGIWFNENDVLHLMMLLWVGFTYKLLHPSLKDGLH
jgi:hypothetical protein